MEWVYTLHGPPDQVAGGCAVITSEAEALELLEIVKRDSVDGIYGFDTETEGWDPKRDKRPPKYRADVVCWSLAWNDGTLGYNSRQKHVPLCKRAFLLWTPAIIEVFRDFLVSEKLVAHNGPGFDTHACANSGVTMYPYIDSASWSKLSNNIPRLGHGLKRLMGEDLGYVERTMRELFHHPAGGASYTREKVGKSKRKVTYQDNPVPTLLGLAYQNVCWSRTVMTPLSEIIAGGSGHSMHRDLVDYASLDAKGCLEGYYMRRPAIKHLGLDQYYDRVWLPQQLVLTTMESNGWPFAPEVCDKGVASMQLEADTLERSLVSWGLCWTETKQPDKVVEDENGEFIAVEQDPLVEMVAPNPRSSDQLKHLLYGRGIKEVAGVVIQGLGLPVPKVCGNLKTVKKTPRGKLPCDEMALLTLANNPDVPENHKPYLLELNELKKKLNDIGKMARFAEASREEPDGRLRYQLKCMTDTGRLSAANQPVQQVPGGGDLRAAFITEEGHKLIVSDYSGLEMRISAHFFESLFGDTTLKQDILGADVHASTAKRIWPELLKDYTPAEIKADKKLKEMYRSPAKIINYAIAYGKTEVGLGVQIMDPKTGKAIGTKAAKVLLDNYINDAYPVIKKYRQWLEDEASDIGWAVKTIHGRQRKLPNLAFGPHDKANKWAYLADKRRMFNTPIQGSAADLMIMAMLKCNPEPLPQLVKLGWWNKKLHDLGVEMLCQIHDELVFHVPEENAEEARDEIKRCMETAMRLKIETPVDIHIVDNWGAAK